MSFSVRGVLGWLRSLLTNRYFWAGIGVLVTIGLILYVTINYVIMPSYTRHDLAITVPNVLNQPVEDAERILQEQDLRVERVVQRFNPNLPRDVVVDQNPTPESVVKPNRRIFLTVNTGTVPNVTVPNVEGLSLREAMNRLRAVGLEIGSTQPDSIPAPFANTVTRQRPAGGDSLREGSTVNLWYSTGLGDDYVTVPDVTGLLVSQAVEILEEHKLRYVVIRQDRPDEDQGTPDNIFSEDLAGGDELIVTGQRREAGTRMREGSEIRLYVEDLDTAEQPTEEIPEEQPEEEVGEQEEEPAISNEQ